MKLGESKNLSLADDLSDFLVQLDADLDFVGVPEKDLPEAWSILNTFKGEAFVTLSLVEDHLNYQARILEVGAGLCLFSFFLKSKGFDVVACEPISGGFGFLNTLKENIRRNFTELELTLLPIEVQHLDRESLGTFDLIFSNNVIEHIPDLEIAFQSMGKLMSDGAIMRHGCPNYLVPYEPHFGIPVLGVLPQLSNTLFRKRIVSKQDVWDSLNFISYSRMRKIARVMNKQIQFDRGVTYNAFMRLSNDPEFANRHKNTIVGKLMRVLIVLRLLPLVRYLPACFSTPMIFSIFDN